MTDYGLVSIITPNYNCGRFIAQTIESVLGQTYQNWELLIQDDCSTDGGYEIALQYAERDPRIKVERNERNKGAALTRNRAIERSQGQWLAYLDSDDLWLPEKLALQLQWMSYRDWNYSFFEYRLIDEDGQPLGKVAKVCKNLSYSKMLRANWSGCLTVMYKQNVNNKIYGPNLKKNNDRGLFVRVLKENKWVGHGIPSVQALYRIRKGSMSRSKWAMVTPFVELVHGIEGRGLVYAYLCVVNTFFYTKLFKYKADKDC